MLDGKVQDETNFTTGIRTIEKRCQNGQTKEGLCWQFVLNGKPIYIRGNNYAPGDAFWPAPRRKHLQKRCRDVRSPRITTWSGCTPILTGPNFTTQRTAPGLLLWQDYPLHGRYSHAPVNPEQAKNQAPEMVYLLGSHPSIAIWSCHNEPGGYQMDWEVRVMDRKVKKILEQTDPTRPVNLASGLVGDTDAHLYFGWYIGQVDGFAKAWNLPDSERLHGLHHGMGRTIIPALPGLHQVHGPGHSTRWTGKIWRSITCSRRKTWINMCHSSPEKI